MSGAWPLALAISWASGWLLVSALVSRPAAAAPRPLLKLCLAAAVGLALSSGVFAVARIFDASSGRTLLLMDLGVLAALFGLWRRRSGPAHAPWVDAAPALPEGRWPRIGLHALLGLAALAALVSIAAVTRNHPHGWWDAWAIWNLKARFLASPGSEWRSAFSELIAWSHTDYPLLLPLGVARLWLYDGSLSHRAPAFLSAAFAALTVGTLYAAVASFRGRCQGALAALCLLGTPAFLEQAPRQIADLPVGFFLLCSLATLGVAWRREPWTPALWILVGLCAGAAAWTKNEGILMVLALATSLGWVVARELGVGRLRSLLGPLLLGLAVPLVALLGFKLLLAGESDLFSGQGWDAWTARALDPERHRAIVEAALANAWTASGAWLLAELALLACATGLARDPESRPLRRVAAATLLLVGAGYYAVYLLTPRELAWQLHTSAPRLFMQLWPSALLLVFVALRPVTALRAALPDPFPPAPGRSASGHPPP